jgi:glycosyltransferase involved in cell wall biosynthesis
MANPLDPTLVHIISASGFYGAERVVANLCCSQKRLHTVVLCLSPLDSNLAVFRQQVEAAGAEFIHINNSFGDAITSLRQLSRTHGKLVLNSHGYKEVVIASLFALITDCRVVATQHGFIQNSSKTKLYNLIDKAFCRWSKVHRVVGVTQTIIDTYRGFGVSEKRLALLPNAIPLPPVMDKQKAREKLAERWQISSQTPIVVFLGRLSAEKGPLLFVDAMDQLLRKHPDCTILIAGDGPQREQVLTRIAHHKRTKQIHWLGFVDDAQTLLAGADLMLLTSTTEGTPMSLLEAMALECVVVAAAVGGIPDIIEDQQNGVLIASRAANSFAQACVTLLQEPRLRQKLARAARHTVEQQYNLEKQQGFYHRDIYALESNP